MILAPERHRTHECTGRHRRDRRIRLLQVLAFARGLSLVGVAPVIRVVMRTQEVKDHGT